jgi:hypothetical protein
MSGKHQAALRFGNGAAQIARRFEPLLNGNFHMAQSIQMASPVNRTAGEFQTSAMKA